MDQPNKLPLVKAALQRLVEQLGENDRVAIVVYAGASGLVLPSTSCLQQGGDPRGHRPACRPAARPTAARASSSPTTSPPSNFIKKGTNRVILATDGDFNVGITDRDELVQPDRGEGQERRLPQRPRLRHGQPQGRHSSRSSPTRGTATTPTSTRSEEADKVLVEEMGATLVTIAKDVKIQVEFNPAKVGAYRLIGYENRILAAPGLQRRHQGRRRDRRGPPRHGALRARPGRQGGEPSRRSTRSSSRSRQSAARPSPESLIVKLRYKRPDEDTSRPDRASASSDEGLDFARPPTTSSSPSPSPGSACSCATRPTREA